MVLTEVETVAEQTNGRSGRQAKRADWQMTRGERLRYYSATAGWTMGFGIVAFFMTMYLIFQGVDLAAVGALILIVKLIDAVDDLFFGFVIDRFNPTQWKFLRKLTGEGKYLPWFRVTFFLLPLTTVLFFAMPSDVPLPVKLVWFAVAYTLYDLASTLSQVPMCSMIVTLTDKVGERDHMLKIRGLILLVIAVTSGLIWQFMVSEFVAWPIAAVAIGSAVIAFFMMAPLSRKVKEHNVELKNFEGENPPKYSLKEAFRAIRTNKYMLIILASDIISGISLTTLTTSVFAAFFLFGNSMVLTLPVLIAFVPGVILQIFADRIAHKLGKRNAIVGFGLLGAITGIILFFVGSGNVAIVVALMAIQAIPQAVNVVLRTFLIPDTVEFTRYKTGQNCAGLFFSMDSFVMKAVSGVSAAVALFVLDLGGWIPVSGESFGALAEQGATQPASALTALWLTISLIPAIGSLLCAIVLSFYTLRDRDASLMAKCNAGEITRAECEAQLSRQY